MAMTVKTPLVEVAWLWSVSTRWCFGSFGSNCTCFRVPLVFADVSQQEGSTHHLVGTLGFRTAFLSGVLGCCVHNVFDCNESWSPPHEVCFGNNVVQVKEDMRMFFVV